MARTVSILLLLFCSTICFSQDDGFKFGQVTYRDLNMKIYDKDSSAAAVVLNEFGEAYIDNENDHNLIFEYHARIKILNKSGLSYANIEIPLWKQDGHQEQLRSFKASGFSIENNSMHEVTVNEKEVFTVNKSKSLDVKKIAIPNVREGSVIEFQYTLESPFIFKFRNWEFQSEIPKVYSEYWAKIPANFTYNITLRGFFQLSKNENELIPDCFSPGGGQRADCTLSKYGMKDIPAFVEEDYMTARSNYISAINFELSEIKYFDGRTDKITKEWKDAEQELKLHNSFGVQIKRGKDIVDEEVERLITGEQDPLTKAKKIYDFIKEWYRWDGAFSKYSELGIKKAFDQKTGNVGDINLSLIAALRYAGLSVEPVILSTRDNGFPTDIHPVLSDFNYVVAKVNIGDKSFLLDATDDFLPFGMLPERCLNGKGRALGEDQSYWIELKPTNRAKRISVLMLKLGKDGVIKGTLQTTYMGYDALSLRKRIYSFNNLEEYVADLDHRLDRIEIKSHEIKNVNDLDKPVSEKLDIELTAFDNSIPENFLFNPFVLNRWDENPFKSSERLYPVDFGTPLEATTTFILEYPEELEIANLPNKAGFALPDAAGRYIFDVQNANSRLTINHSLFIGKTLFSSKEYHYLKELFNRIIQIENGDLLFKKKA